MHFNTVDLVGQTFERLTVLSKAPNRGRRVAWNCQCVCGRTCVVIAYLLKSGSTRSCGCLKVEVSTKRMTVHGHARGGNVSLEYKVWCGMLKRCNDLSCVQYQRYGGRGIRVCERWREFKNFYADMGPRPSAKHSIERKNNDGNYDPENCRWATQSEQMQNTSAVKLLTFNGQSKSLAAWSREFGVKQTTLSARLRRGWPVERAIKP